MTLLLILPATICILLIFIVPLIVYFWASFHASSVITSFNFIGNESANWSRILDDSRFWQDAIQTIRFTTTSVFFEILLALLIAITLNESFKGKGIIRAITLLPWALPTTLLALSWRWIFNTPYGPIELIARILNIGTINILSNPDITWIATVVADVWKTTPFIALILLAGLQSIPKNIYEAFKLEGGNDTTAFFKITFPLLQPYLVISLVFRIAQAFGVFDLIQVMTGGGPSGSTESLGLYAYLNAMRYLDFGYSSTIIIASFILLLCLTSISYYTLVLIQKIFKLYL
tara:strand:+ start:1605 stop:2471 length:867 start_codon:yes stop_codon:yes gene_type:complete